MNDNVCSLLWTEKNIAEDQLYLVAQKIYQEISKGETFCLWLRGQMGAGKTRITREIMRLIGLPQRFPVPSPTFSLINEYEINSQLYLHMDLYRVDSYLDLEDLGINTDRIAKGFFVEWPQNMPPNETLRPSHYLDIEPSTTPNTRTYLLYKL